MQRIQRQFSSQVHTRPATEPRVVVIELRGEIDAFAEAAFNAACDEAESHDLPVILLDFNDVDYINSTGLALIVGLLARARVAGRRLLVTGLSEHYRQIFEITRLSDFIALYPDTTSALAAV